MFTSMNPFAIFDPRGFGALEMPNFKTRPVQSMSYAIIQKIFVEIKQFFCNKRCLIDTYDVL